MRTLLIIISILYLSPLLTGSGCTKVDTPVRETSDESETDGNGDEGDDGDQNGDTHQSGDFTIILYKNEILDTEPLLLTAEGGDGLIFWKTDPHYDNCFQPETGLSVLFLPPDISGEIIISIQAEDEQNRTAQAAVTVIDEGEPPQKGDILLNEIAWCGTLTSAYDEYVEILNRADRPFYLNNWRIENGAGSGFPLSFSGKIESNAVFLIANYLQESEKTAITGTIHYTDAGLSLNNSACGPFILSDQNGTIFDIVGDGGSYLHGANEENFRASMSRYTYSATTEWDPGSWYTESISINLIDGTSGTPGAVNSDTPFQTGISDSDAAAVITEYAIDPQDEIGMDWVELYITKDGSIMNFVVTDLDGDDLPITNGADIGVSAGEYLLIIWHDFNDEVAYDEYGYLIDGNRIYIPDKTPTGTKDQLVLLCSSTFLDGLCYYSDNDLLFDDDEDDMREYGWTGDPIHGKRASKKLGGGGDYINDLTSASWDVEAGSTPGLPN